jgi:hypothetical protein
MIPRAEARPSSKNYLKEDEMKKPLCYLEFVVSNLEEIRLLVTQWDETLSLAFDDTPWDFQFHTALVTGWAQIWVIVEDRLPGQEVLLHFVAPWEVVERFLDALEAKGKDVGRRDVVAGFIIKCWFQPPESDT